MAKRNKRQQRKKANTKKRNLQRANRRTGVTGLSGASLGDDGLSLAEAGVKDIYEVLQWSKVLINEPEFADPIFDPGRCVATYGKQIQALGLSELDVESMPKEFLYDKQAELMLATVDSVLTKKEQREIKRRLKMVLFRWTDENRTRELARINILISLIDFAKDNKTWGTIGLVVGLVMKQVEDVMRITATAQNINVGEGSVDDQLNALRESPEWQKMEDVVSGNPNLVDFYRNQLDHAWANGMNGFEEGKLSLFLFPEEDYELAEIYLEESKTDGGDFDSSEAEAFMGKVLDLVTTRMESAAFVTDVQQQLTEIMNGERVAGDYLPFIMQLRDSFDDADWVKDAGRYVMMRSFFADMRATGEEDDASLDDVADQA